MTRQKSHQTACPLSPHVGPRGEGSRLYPGGALSPESHHDDAHILHFWPLAPEEINFSYDRKSMCSGNPSSSIRPQSQSEEHTTCTTHFPKSI